MSLQDSIIQQNCPSEEIFHYLEGELSATEELSLEKHFAECETCLNEFSSQKELSRALNFAFNEESEIELPKDYTKVIVSKAESNVSGLRTKRELTKAIFLSCALFLILAIGFRGETEKGFATTREFGREILTVLGFVTHFIYEISIGLVVVLRFLGQQVVFSPLFLFALISATIAVFSLWFFARLKFSRS
jgi:predicted anti-sigma-YlaC factor YlaD